MIRRVLALALLAVTGTASCTPVRTTIHPPYDIDGKRYETVTALETYATENCDQARNGEDPPDYKFTSDGCSAYPDDGWRACCIKHDVAYWCGVRVRLEADREFRRCVRGASSATNAYFMFLGVRIGGGRFSPFPWRYGYGHPWPHKKPSPPPTPP